MNIVEIAEKMKNVESFYVCPENDFNEIGPKKYLYGGVMITKEGKSVVLGYEDAYMPDPEEFPIEDWNARIFMTKAEALSNFKPKTYDTWILAYENHTKSFVLTNQRGFYWESERDAGWSCDSYEALQKFVQSVDFPSLVYKMRENDPFTDFPSKYDEIFVCSQHPDGMAVTWLDEMEPVRE